MRYVIALGGNALVDKRAIGSAAKAIARLYKEGNEIVITHGNGPQVGELAIAEHESLAVLTAQTQAWIGLNIESSIAKALEASGQRNSYAIPEVVLTKTVVSKADSAFRNPTKPIGRFYTKREASRLPKVFKIRKLINGYRRVVPSPQAKEIVERDLILKLLGAGHIVIACGGGGIPVFRKENRLSFAEAVIDKDNASALLAREISAERFIILTNVDGIYLDFRKKAQRLIGSISSKELQRYFKEGRFESGSMAPKVKACLDFVNSAHRPAAIGNIHKAQNVILGKGTTCITY